MSEILLITHATVGGLSLLAGTIVLLLPKGKHLHFTWGNIFYWSMLFTGCSAVILSLLPDIGSLFLLLIGGMSAYFAMSGKRMLRWKKRKTIRWRDKALFYLISALGFVFILAPLLGMKNTSWMFYVFGGGCLFFAQWDYQLLTSMEKRKMGWLKNHISKMMGGYIAAWSAFLVVNDVFPYSLNWFAASIVGVPLIVLWIRRIESQEKWIKIIKKNLRSGGIKQEHLVEENA